MRTVILTLLCAAATTVAAAQDASLFASARDCAACHSNLPQTAGPGPMRRGMGRQAAPLTGASIAPVALWEGSLMAHAAVDPYWRAKVRFETATTPAAREQIEDKCMSCHAPMQQYESRRNGVPAKLDWINALGAEGVSCTVCHQIAKDRLGTRDSFSAGFAINPAREIYGPHADPFEHPMLHHTGFRPVESRHILDSALCGACHTVITPTLDDQGRKVGEFVEQAPYLEWLASDLPAAGRTCQSCHVPALTDSRGGRASEYIAHRPGWGYFPPTSPRSPFGQHFFAGGNAQMLGLLAGMFPQNRQLPRTLARTRQMLANAVHLTVRAETTSGRVVLDVELRNLTGHKLPTGYPSRRMWLHVVVRDRDGVPLFESGAFDPMTGEIAGLAQPQPHYSSIDSPVQVMIYEPQLQDAAGHPTTSLMRAARYRKDNRLLPRGFDLSRPLPAGVAPGSIAPSGIAGDPDFLPGSDRISYSIALPEGRQPWTAVVEVLFQSIQPRDLEGMEAARSQEEAAFLGQFPKHNEATVIATGTVALAPGPPRTNGR